MVSGIGDDKVIEDELNIDDTKLGSLYAAMNPLLNCITCDFTPTLRGDYRREIMERIDPPAVIVTDRKTNEILLQVNFTFRNNDQKDVVEIIINQHISFKEHEYPRDIVKALGIPLQTADMAKFLVDVFGKAIISKTEIENVFGRSQFGFVKQELSSDENVRFLYLNNEYYVIIMNKIGTTPTLVGNDNSRKMKEEYRDIKELSEILDKIDTPEKAYGKGIEVCNNANNKHELEFFKKIHDNYSRLLRKEKEVNEKKLNISTVAFLLPALALFFAVFFIEINKTELWNFLSLCLLMPTLYFIVLFLVIALFKSKDDEILLVSMVQGSRLLLIIWAIAGMLLTYYDILPFLILLSLTIYYASVVVYYEKSPALFDRSEYSEIQFIYIAPTFLAAIFGTFYSARSQMIIQYTLLLSVAGSLLFSSFYLIWVSTKNKNIENCYKIIQKIFEKLEGKTDKIIKLSLSRDLKSMNMTMNKRKKKKTAEKCLDKIQQREDKRREEWNLPGDIECWLV